MGGWWVTTLLCMVYVCQVQHLSFDQICLTTFFFLILPPLLLSLLHSPSTSSCLSLPLSPPPLLSPYLAALPEYKLSTQLVEAIRSKESTERLAAILDSLPTICPDLEGSDGGCGHRCAFRSLTSPHPSPSISCSAGDQGVSSHSLCPPCWQQDHLALLLSPP